MNKVIVRVQLDKSLPHFLKDGLVTLEKEFVINLDEYAQKLNVPIDPQERSGVSVLISKNEVKPAPEDESDVYCKYCGTCGYIACCGIESFIKEHILDNKPCLNAEQMAEEIKYLYEEAFKKEL